MDKKFFFIVCIFTLITFAAAAHGLDITMNQSITSPEDIRNYQYDTNVKLSADTFFSLPQDNKFFFRSSSSEAAVEIEQDELEELDINETGAAALLDANKISDNEIELKFKDEFTEPEFIWPVQGSITSYYGLRWNPLGWGRQFHDGIDISAPGGTPVLAAASGQVIKAQFDRGHGNNIIIEHQNGYRTMYTHLSRMHVQVGDEVETGDHIGDVGRTGWATGNHLHLTFFKDGETVNPLDYLPEQ